MALVKYGGGIIQMSGSVAGNTYARNRYGNYMRARTKPVNPNTTSQDKIRSVIAFLTEYWYETLEAVQRAAWNNYADAIVMKNALGESIKLSGFNHFIRSNSVLTYNDLAEVADGPTNMTLPDKDPTLSFDIGESGPDIVISFDINLSWVSEDGGYMTIQQGRPQNVTRNFFAGPYHRLGLITGASGDGPTSPQSLPKYYPIAEGQKQWIRARIIRADARLSEQFIATDIASA